jgi:sugar phosphate isomerase/epimerase
MTWHIGASTGCCTERPIQPVLEALADTGIKGVEIGTPPKHFDPWQRAQVDLVKAELARTGIAAVAMHAPFGGMLDLSESNLHHRNAAIGAILTVASVLKELGGTLLVVHPTDVPRAGDAATRLNNAADSLQRLQRACTELAITLAIETPLPHLVGGSPDEFQKVLEIVGLDAKVCIDTGHTTLGHQWEQFLTIAGTRIVHVHATDHRGHRDDHLPPGQGAIDWTAIGHGLRRIGYSGWLMLELHCPSEPLRTYFSHAADRLGELVGMAHADIRQANGISQR